MLHTFWQILYNSVVILFAICGFIQVLKSVILRLYKSKGDRTILLIAPFGNNDFDAEYTLRSCIAKIRWTGKSGPQKVICLDAGMNENSKKICELMHKKYEYLEIMSTEEFISLFSGRNQ